MDDAAREVVAMQFAGGRSIAALAEDWERDAAWVEDAVRQALLEKIPKAAGGLKAPRAADRALRNAKALAEDEALRDAQGVLRLE